jgi:tripartite-type tricarboxylate transporter receptor subunit TctC
MKVHLNQTGRGGKIALRQSQRKNQMKSRRRFVSDLGGVAIASSIGGFSLNAWSQAVARLVVGFPAGATGDRIARAVAPSLAASLGTTVIVENKAGAAGQLAVELVKNAPADGALLLQTIGSSMAIYPHTYKVLRYRPFEDFIPIGTVATVPIVLVAATTTPAKTLGEAVALLKRDRKYSFYGSPTAGGVFHFSGVLLQRALQTEFEHVPYKGSAPLLQDVLSGQVPFGFMAQSDILEHYRAGKLKILADTGTSRTSQLPEVPTFPELGYTNLVNRESFSYFLAANTPNEIVSKYRIAVRKAVASEEVRKKLLDAGLEMGEGESAALASTMRKEYAQWKTIVKEIGFVAD